jgi:hypothetical protein
MLHVPKIEENKAIVGGEIFRISKTCMGFATINQTGMYVEILNVNKCSS